MNLEKRLREYGKAVQADRAARAIPREQEVKDTIQKSIDAFCRSEQERMMTYGEFLWEQLRVMRKKWWVFQAMLLLTAWVILRLLDGIWAVQRLLGIAASLFVILIIPELWKSQTCRSMELEAVSYFSLRQIYAARMQLSGMVDIVLLTFFCLLSSATLDMALPQLIVQFLFPMAVTACICLGVLCSRHPIDETAAVTLCMLWSAAWVLVVLNEKIYGAITFPLWIGFLGAALCFLAFVVCRALHGNYFDWEIKGGKGRWN